MSRTMSCDLVETRMRIRPRESSLSHPFIAAWLVAPIVGRPNDSVTRSSLERRSRTACDRTSRRTQQVIDQRCVRPASANDTSTTSTHVSFGDPGERVPRMHGAFHDAPRTSDESVSIFRRGRFLPTPSTELRPLTLPSPRSACPPLHRALRAGFRLQEETPSPR